LACQIGGCVSKKAKNPGGRGEDRATGARIKVKKKKGALRWTVLEGQLRNLRRNGNIIGKGKKKGLRDLAKGGRKKLENRSNLLEKLM